MRLNKRWLAAMVLICGFHLHVDAQYYVETPKVFNGGLILGANLAQVDGDNYYGFHKIGLQAGGQVYIHFTSKLGATMDLLYSQKGSRGTAVSQSQYIGTYVGRYHMNINYVEVPVTFHYKEHGLDFEAGMAYCRLINSNEYIQADKQISIDPVANAFNSSDLEYVVGLTVKAYKKLFINARYEYSVISIRSSDKIPKGFGYGSDGQYNNVFNLRAIYQL